MMKPRSTCTGNGHHEEHSPCQHIQCVPREEATTDDPTEEARRALVVAVNTEPADRVVLEARYGQVWSTSELANDFEVLGFAAPFVVVKRKSDGKVGSLMFQHHPRFYFSFESDHAHTPLH